MAGGGVQVCRERYRCLEAGPTATISPLNGRGVVYVRRQLLASVLAAVAVAAGAVGVAEPSARSDAASARAAHLVRLAVLSTRADLVSGGEALVQLFLPPGARAAGTRLDVNGRDVTRQFALLSGGKFEGLVTGLANGRNVLTARLPDGYGAHLTITNHPLRGPIISG